MNNKQVLVYGLLELKNDLRSIFVGQIHFKKLMKFRKYVEIFRNFKISMKYFTVT